MVLVVMALEEGELEGPGTKIVEIDVIPNEFA
jgi:hypothetical protein